MLLPDYYAILGVSNDATLEEIKRAYRRLARKYHPDVNKETQDERIKKLNAAYAVLSNTAGRAAYDIQRLEAKRTALIVEMLRRRQFEQSQQPRMTWKEGVIGFVRELKKGLHG
ncbi:MAG TPA: DnaJ domain-containing protein [Ktedonobacteraceae bacterium]|jgi:curved DNA-binding protein CbpA|nr:DnaJ domain-containing protein [Ktedonobacteraceae bacterium]